MGINSAFRGLNTALLLLDRTVQLHFHLYFTGKTVLKRLPCYLRMPYQFNVLFNLKWNEESNHA
jgi:hypothetical protein